MSEHSERRIVDPRVREARAHFDRMMAMLRAMTNEEYAVFGFKAGFLNEDGSPKLPEGDPCVTRVA